MTEKEIQKAAMALKPGNVYLLPHGAYVKKSAMGGLYWYDKNHNFHREDGPAIEYGNGDKDWYIRGMRHREDGPAMTGRTMPMPGAYFLNDVQLTEEVFKKKILRKKIENILEYIS